MTAYLLTAAGVIFLTVVVGLIIPEGKLNKSVNFILRLICICVLVSPVTQLFEFSAQTSEIIADFDYICRIYSQNQSDLLEQKIFDELGIECDCTVNVVYEDGCVKENGVVVAVNLQGAQTIENIVEYLESLGYINITVNEEGG